MSLYTSGCDLLCTKMRIVLGTSCSALDMVVKEVTCWVHYSISDASMPV
jgi:hypothetical protein